MEQSEVVVQEVPEAHQQTGQSDCTNVRIHTNRHIHMRGHVMTNTVLTEKPVEKIQVQTTSSSYYTANMLHIFRNSETGRQAGSARRAVRGLRRVSTTQCQETEDPEPASRDRRGRENRYLVRYSHVEH